MIGVAIACTGLVANATSAVVARSLAKEAAELGGALGMTAIGMAVGGLAMLVAGAVMEGVPTPNARGWLIIAWLAVVNTALAFTLWNHTLRMLTAVESSVLNNAMLVQIAALAWVFLGESLDGRQLAGLALAVIGVVIVQLVPVERSRRETA